MRLKLMNIGRQMWQRNMSSQSGRTAYISEVQKLQSSSFYPVYVGKTEINERLLTGDISCTVNPKKETQKPQPLWSIIHAGGARGWVPWNYKLHAYLSNFKVRADETIFPELCSTLKDHYGKCAIIVNPKVSEDTQNGKTENSLYPTSPVKFLPMICCPKVAESYGHKMLRTFNYYSPINIAWSNLKWFIKINREKFTEEILCGQIRHKMIDFDELLEAALNNMTPDKWKDAVTNELESRSKQEYKPTH
ncbi:hypothetical protein C0J45_4938 [Silurus meridionalis]|nr:hypothetical protein C0J45_4938 [Silurus meridionalis]